MENKIVLDYELVTSLAKSKGYLAGFLYDQMEKIFNMVLQERPERAKIEYDYLVAVLEDEKFHL